MKKLFYLMALCLVAAMTACEFERSDNGALDGFWQMHSIDTLETGNTADMRQVGIYWSVQMNMLTIAHHEEDELYQFRFSHDDDVLRLYDPRQCFRPGDGQRIDSAITDVTVLQPLGLNSLDERFKVLELNHSRMVLVNSLYRMHFRKY